MRLFNTVPFLPLILGVLIGGTIGAALGYFGQCSSGMCPLTATWWRGMLFGALIGALFALPKNESRPATNDPPPKQEEQSWR